MSGPLVSSRRIFVVAGPNGAGKSTTAPALLRDRFGILAYVNADTIAAGLCAFDPGSVALQAGRIMLEQFRYFREQHKSFAFETTLSTRSYVRWLKDSRQHGYSVILLFLSLPSAEEAIERVALRVRLGGHDIPEDVIRRRYERGLSNFFQLYRPILDRWFFADNGGRRPMLLAHGGIERVTVETSTRFRSLEEQYGPR